MIRRATKEDFFDIQRMVLAFKDSSLYEPLSFSSECLLKSFSSILDNSNYIALVYEEDREIHGMLIGAVTEFLFSSDLIAGELVWWIDLKQRKGRAGSELKYTFEQWAKDKKATIITMVLLEDENLQLIDKIYRSGGYKPAERTYIKEIQ